MPARYCYEYPRPAVTVDVVVFALLDQSLRVLLIRRKHEPFAGRRAIPGGFLEVDEPVDEAARRELREETGLEIPGPLEPIGFFAKPGRDPRGRTISLAHAAVIRSGNDRIQGGDDAAEAAWVEVKAAINLAFDHEDILKEAKEWLIHRVTVGDRRLAIVPLSFVAQDVHVLFRDLGLSRRRAHTWLDHEKRMGRIVEIGDPFPHFYVTKPTV
jgi:8-oxo-dGTP diphosphatase